MDVSLLYGGITHHYISPKLNYCNRINNYGTIRNEYVIGLVGSKKTKAGFILGKDSACGSVAGPVFSYSLHKNFEVIAGAYNANIEKFTSRGFRPIEWGGISPILGIDYRVYLTKNISIDTLVSYAIITHSLRIDF